MSNFSNRLKEYFAVTPQDQVLKDWGRAKEWDCTDTEFMINEITLASNFINIELVKLSERMGHIFLLAYDDEKHIHIVIVPKELYDSDIAYLSWESVFARKFLDTFKDQLILFTPN